MSKFVSSIFKTLIGTVVVIVLSSLLVELYNIQVTTLNLRTLSKIAAQQSCDLFAQETYKTRSTGGTVDMSNISYGAGYTDDGQYHAGWVYFNESMYPSVNAESNWRALYTKSEYKDFVNTYKDKFLALEILDDALDPSFSERTDVLKWGTVDLDYERNKLAATYKDNLYTPLNLGITYLDEDTVQRIYRWNLIQLLTNCDTDNIHVDSSGEPYIMYKGFRVYARDAEIEISYKTYNLDNISERNSFAKLTGIEHPEKLIKTNDDTLSGSKYEEFRTICVAEIQYKVPVSYIGITPIQKVCEFTWNKRVRGMEANAPAASTDRWSNNTEDLIGGKQGQGVTGVTLPAYGKLVYYVVR